MLEYITSAAISAMTATFLKDIIDAIRRMKKEVHRIEKVQKVVTVPKRRLFVTDIGKRLKQMMPIRTLHEAKTNLPGNRSKLVAYIKLVLWQMAVGYEWGPFYEEGLTLLPWNEARFLEQAITEMIEKGLSYASTTAPLPVVWPQAGLRTRTQPR